MQAADVDRKAMPDFLFGCFAEVVQAGYGAICGEAPRPGEEGCPPRGLEVAVGMLSFVGDLNLTLLMTLPPETAEAISVKFTGAPLAYGSRDLDDLVGELVNILAGDIRARLEERGIASAMSLPLVIRGTDVHVAYRQELSSRHQRFDAQEGPFWMGVTVPHLKGFHPQMPGE